MPKGTVFKSTGSHYRIKTEDGEFLDAIIRGKVRLQGLKTTNPIAVGDQVLWEKDAYGAIIIQDVLDRQNYIIRRATNLSKQRHILAANLDQAVLVFTLVLPKVSEGFLDRFLVTAEAYGIPAVLVLNKIDLLESPELQEWKNEICELYTQIGYTVVECSAHNKTGLDKLAEILHGKTSLFSGFSGVGKSSLLNALFPGITQKTGEISHFSMKGKHTTTFAEMFEATENTYLIDTPGIKELGIVGVEGSEIALFMPDLKPYALNCRFHNCSHTHEPGCEVRVAAEEGKIALSRYRSYLSMLENDDNRR